MEELRSAVTFDYALPSISYIIGTIIFVAVVLHFAAKGKP